MALGPATLSLALGGLGYSTQSMGIEAVRLRPASPLGCRVLGCHPITVLYRSAAQKRA